MLADGSTREHSGAAGTSSHKYLRSAISASTRATYAAPIAKYQAYCKSRGAPDLLVSVSIVEDWLASVADSGELRARIRVYRSAISTYHEENDSGGRPNPLQTARFERFLKGVDRLLHAADKAAREAKPAIFSITPVIIAELELHASGGSPSTS